MAEPVREPGFEGQLVSLAGVRGAKGLGRVSTRFDRTTAAATAITGIPANPLRIAATVQNISGSDTVSAYLGGTAGARIDIAAGDFLQIDYKLPWSGVITLLSAGINTVVCNELTVQQ